MLNIFKNLIRKKESKIVLGRWGRTNDVTKSIYANSDHCGDILCGNPKEVKRIVNRQKNIKVKLPVSNKFHTNSTINQKNISNEHFCCMLLGMNGPCNDCIIHPKGLINQKTTINKYDLIF